VRQAPTGAILDEIVDEKAFVPVVELVQEPLAFPHWAADGRFAQDDLEDELPVDAELPVSVEDGGQRSTNIRPASYACFDFNDFTGDRRPYPTVFKL